MIDAASLRAAGTSPVAIARHYDLPPEFFALWLGRDHVYSCALWDDDDPRDELDVAQSASSIFSPRRLAFGAGVSSTSAADGVRCSIASSPCAGRPAAWD